MHAQTTVETEGDAGSISGSPAAMLAVNEVHKGFGRMSGRPAQSDTDLVLSGVTFDVRAGEVVSLLGASGCGKTTLLRIIAGLIQADTGSVTIQNTAVRLPRKDLCMVFQSAGLFPWRTVLANVSFPLELDHVPRRQREEIAREYLSIVGLDGYENHYPHELSGGMQQRVGIARGLVRRPLLLLMDEPFGALDAQTRETLQDDFLKIWKRLKTTVVFVTHSIEESLLLSDRIIVLGSRPGRIRQTIAPPFSEARATQNVRALPEFSDYSRLIRDLLRTERQP